jgi:hypothetical protein
MNLAFLFPTVILVALIVWIFYSRRSKGAGGSGLGDRSDATEPRELRGPEQWKTGQH